MPFITVWGNAQLTSSKSGNLQFSSGSRISDPPLEVAWVVMESIIQDVLWCTVSHRGCAW